MKLLLLEEEEEQETTKKSVNIKNPFEIYCYLSPIHIHTSAFG